MSDRMMTLAGPLQMKVSQYQSIIDIGTDPELTIHPSDALELGKEGGQHRKFLNAFFVNRHPGSFARGVPFQDNPKTVSSDLAVSHLVKSHLPVS